jgi:hypothetical protein
MPTLADLLQGLRQEPEEAQMPDNLARLINQPAIVNAMMQARMEAARKNLARPDGVTDPRWDAWAKSQRDADGVWQMSEIAGAAAPLKGVPAIIRALLERK